MLYTSKRKHLKSRCDNIIFEALAMFTQTLLANYKSIAFVRLSNEQLFGMLIGY